MEEIAELFKKLVGVIEGLQGIVKQYNIMLLDLYERIAKLEAKAEVASDESEVK